LTGEPFLLMGKSWKTSDASWDSDAGESSMTGISTRNLGCFSFLSFPTSFGLLRGFSKVGWKRIWRTGWIWVCRAELEDRMGHGNGSGVGGGGVGLNRMGDVRSGFWRVEMKLMALQF